MASEFDPTAEGLGDEYLPPELEAPPSAPQAPPEPASAEEPLPLELEPSAVTAPPELQEGAPAAVAAPEVAAQPPEISPRVQGVLSNAELAELDSLSERVARGETIPFAEGQRMLALQDKAGPDWNQPEIPDYSKMSAVEFAAAKNDLAEKQMAARKRPADVAAQDKVEAEVAARQRMDEVMRKAQERTDELERRLVEHREKKNDAGTLTTGERIAAVIAAALDGWLNPGGKNKAIETITAVVHQRVQAQREEYERAGETLRQEIGLVGQLRRAGYSDYTATMAAIAADYQTALNEIDREVAGIDPASSKAIRAEEVRRDVLTELEKTREEYRKSNLKEALDTAKVQIEAAKAGSGDAEWRARLQLDRAKFEAEQRKAAAAATAGKLHKWDPEVVTGLAEALGIPKEDRNRMVVFHHRQGQKPQVFLANTPAQAAALSKTVPATNILVDHLSQMHRLVDEHGHEFDNMLYRSKYGSLMKTTNKLVMLLLKDAEEMGALQSGEIKFLKELVGKPPSLFARDKEGILTSIEASRKHYIDRMNENFVAAGAIDPRTWMRIPYAPVYSDDWREPGVDTSDVLLQLKKAHARRVADEAQGVERFDIIGDEAKSFKLLTDTVRRRGLTHPEHRKQVEEARSLYGPDDEIVITEPSKNRGEPGKMRLVNARDYLNGLLSRGSKEEAESEKERAKQQRLDAATKNVPSAPTSDYTMIGND